MINSIKCLNKNFSDITLESSLKRNSILSYKLGNDLKIFVKESSTFGFSFSIRAV